MKRDYVVFVPKIDTGSRITRSACHFVTRYIVSSDQYFYSDRERTAGVKGTRREKKKKNTRKEDENEGRS